MTALLVGAALAVAALVYVLFPLFDIGAATRPRAARRATKPMQSTETAVDALREIEFDRATGKLSDDDYASLKTQYTRTALVELRAREGAAASGSPGTALVMPLAGDPNDAAEAAVLSYRAVHRECATCGPRPEPDPAFCSACGTYLKGACAHCGATVDAPASRFCANCGESLAA